MKTSKCGLEFITSWESVELKPYKDAAGYWTIGVGHLIKPGEKFTELTYEEALDLLDTDVIPFERTINDFVTVPLKQHQFDALVSFAFNVGSKAFRNSTLLRKLNAKDITGAANELLKWNKAGGRVLKGLVRRREAERETFLTGKYIFNK